MKGHLEYLQKTGNLEVLAKLYLDNKDCEFVQMASIMSAAGEYFVGDRDK